MANYISTFLSVVKHPVEWSPDVYIHKIYDIDAYTDTLTLTYIKDLVS